MPLEFATLDQANLAVERINRIAAYNWNRKGKRISGNTLIDDNGFQTLTWDTPQLIGGKYQVNFPIEDSRYAKAQWLNEYNIGLPINAEGGLSGSMVSHYPPDIWFVDNEYFTVLPSGIIKYKTPASGATSPNSTTVRSELRHLTDYSYMDTMENDVVFSVDGTDNLVIVHQLHGNIETLYMAKMMLASGDKMNLRLFVDKKEDNSDTVAITVREGIKFGDKIKLSAKYTPGTFKVYMDDELTLTVDNIAPRVNNTYCYWKKGAYGFSSEVSHYPI